MKRQFLGAPTRLEAFIKAHGIGLIDLERASGLSRQHLARLRLRNADARRSTIAAVVRGCRALLPDINITALDLFQLE